ncbi:MAG: hypothetical protein HYX97_05060 [Chloroflexi bacterium]|nr:hypothetical protein [Chloroflexota bacterium]
MNLRITIIFLVAAVVAVTWALGYDSGSTANRKPTDRDFPAYSIPAEQLPKGVSSQDYLMEHMSTIKVTHLGQSQTFVRSEEDKNEWRFDSPSGPPVHPDRWSGITLLLSGPNTSRRFKPDELSIADAGLDNPQTIIDIGLDYDDPITDTPVSFTLLLGDKTADGAKYYLQFQDGVGNRADIIDLVDTTWGDVMSRLVTEPPLIPTPAPSQ